MNFFHKYKEYRPSPILFAFQIFLFILIVIGIGLIFTRDMWTPSLVSYILKNDESKVQTPDSEVVSAPSKQDVFVNRTEVVNPVVAVAEEDNNSEADINDWKVYLNPELGISFKYPSYGFLTKVSIGGFDDESGVKSIFIDLATTDNPEDFYNSYWVTVIPNKNSLSLSEWVFQTIDCSGSVRENQLYSLRTLANGTELFNTGKLPQEHFEKCRAGSREVWEYAMPASKKFIVIVDGPSNPSIERIQDEDVTKLLESVTDTK